MISVYSFIQDNSAFSPLRLFKGGTLVIGIEVVVLAVLGYAVQVAVGVQQLLPTLGQIRGKEGGEVSSEHHGFIRLGLEPSRSPKRLNEVLKILTFAQA